MKEDPAIEDIRKTRHEISRRFGNDTKALIEHYKELQKGYAGRIRPEPSDPENGRGNRQASASD